MGPYMSTWHWMLRVLAVLLITPVASPVFAGTVSYGYDATFSHTIMSNAPPTGSVVADTRAVVHDPQERLNQDNRTAEVDGIHPRTLSCVAAINPPINSASAKSDITANPYTVDPAGGYVVSGGYKLSGKATAHLPHSDAFAVSSATERFDGIWQGPSGTVTNRPTFEASSSRYGQVAVCIDLLCQANEEAVRHLLLGGIDLTGDTRLNWNSTAPERNFSIYAPMRSGNNVHFQLDLSSSYNLDPGNLEVVIQDGVLQKFSKKGTLFEAVDILHEGDTYYVLNLGPLTINFNLGEIGTKNPNVRLELLTQGKGQLAPEGKAMSEINLLLLD
jgi:hypothetical protein